MLITLDLDILITYIDAKSECVGLKRIKTFLVDPYMKIILRTDLNYNGNYIATFHKNAIQIGIHYNIPYLYALLALYNTIAARNLKLCNIM